MQSILILLQAFLAIASFPSPIPFPSLPSLFAPDADLSPPDPIAESQIRNTLATYIFSIDSKTFTALSSVFHPDAVANYSEPINVISGLPEITATLEASLARFAGTQHSYEPELDGLAGEPLADSVPLLPKEDPEEEDEELAGRGGALLGPYRPFSRRAKVPRRPAETFVLRRLKSGATHLILALSAVVRTGLASTAFLMGAYQLLTNQFWVALSGPAAAIT
ncbi:hypothetical protein SLS63_005396 [Diaporthe eres]|uniref:SnoaL-like domain-containing protein n=1 Tax=Diaporthe eres TaxID=83184 RepID=A0ABR1PAN7_DIAER